MLLLFAGWKLCSAISDNWDTIVDTTTLAWQTVRDWLTARRTTTSDVGNIVREQLANGSFRVVGGVFTSTGQKRETRAWECSAMDDELRRQLGNQNRITVSL